MSDRTAARRLPTSSTRLKNMRTPQRFSIDKIPTTLALTGAALMAATLALLQSPQSANAADAPSAGDAERGAEQFDATCAECHGASATAPTLRGIIGREVASVASFTTYSEGLKAKRPMKWTKETLDAYITAPNKFVPGSLMFRQYSDPQMRADIIAFLETLPPPRE